MSEETSGMSCNDDGVAGCEKGEAVMKKPERRPPGRTEFYDPFRLDFCSIRIPPKALLGFRPPSSPCPPSPQLLPTTPTTTTAPAPRHTTATTTPRGFPEDPLFSFLTTCHEQRIFGSGFNCAPSRCWPERLTVLNELGLVERPSGDVPLPFASCKRAYFCFLM